MIGLHSMCSSLVLLLLSTLVMASSILEQSKEPYSKRLENTTKTSEDDSQSKERILGLLVPALLSELFKPEASVGYSASNPEASIGYSASNGPNIWSNKFPTSCAGSRQSGININLAKAVSQPYGANPALSQRYYDVEPLTMTLANKGLTLTLTGTWPVGKSPTIRGFILHGDYGIAEIHFHWGENRKEGSEHLLNGRSFPLEMHVVHYKLKYGSFQNALSEKDGLAVTGYFFELRKEANQALQRLISASIIVRDPKNSSVSITPFPINELAPTFNSNYVSYLGSLTVPTCNEVVTWIVNLRPLGVSKDQLLMLRKLMNTDGRLLLKNFRPVQPLNGRQLTYVP